jgi:hypothetical protein
MWMVRLLSLALAGGNGCGTGSDRNSRTGLNVMGDSELNSFLAMADKGTALLRLSDRAVAVHGL